MIRAQFTLENISVETLKSFIWNVNNYITWQYNTIEAEMISNSGHDEMKYRSLVHAPWPVENRELVVNLRVMPNDSAMTSILIHSFPYDKPPPDNVVRVPLFDASWKITPKGNMLNVVYTLRIDPGGSVPAWLANLAMAEGPYISFKNLKDQLEKK